MGRSRHRLVCLFPMRVEEVFVACLRFPLLSSLFPFFLCPFSVVATASLRFAVLFCIKIDQMIYDWGRYQGFSCCCSLLTEPNFNSLFGKLKWSEKDAPFTPSMQNMLYIYEVASIVRQTLAINLKQSRPDPVWFYMNLCTCLVSSFRRGVSNAYLWREQLKFNDWTISVQRWRVGGVDLAEAKASHQSINHNL